MSQANSESCAAAKGGISALTHALAASLAYKVRVNSISPGWIETDGQEWEGADALQQSAGRVGKPEDIADMILFLASDHVGFINGKNIRIDGGMTRQMIYHGEEGWAFDPSKQEQLSDSGNSRSRQQGSCRDFMLYAGGWDISRFLCWLIPC